MRLHKRMTEFLLLRCGLCLAFLYAYANSPMKVLVVESLQFRILENSIEFIVAFVLCTLGKIVFIFGYHMTLTLRFDGDSRSINYSISII